MDPRDAPIWSALSSHHADGALVRSSVRRYRADVAPFLAVDPATCAAPDEEALADLVPAGDTALLLGEPPRLSSAWSLRWQADLAQMAVSQERSEPAGVEAIRALGEAERDDVLELTALVYPHYFRPNTMQLGRYFGIYREGRLAAMVGERMRMPGHTEISAVCTHPDFLGQGLARRLFGFLAARLRDEGTQPFLHVSTANARAVELYARNGFALRRLIPFWSLQRSP